MAVGVDDLAEQEGAPVAETRGVPAELVPGVGLRHRCGAARQKVADQHAEALRAQEEGGLEAEVDRQRLVEQEQPGVRHVLGPPRNSHLRKLAGEAVAEGDRNRECRAHLTKATRGTAIPGSPTAVRLHPGRGVGSRTSAVLAPRLRTFRPRSTDTRSISQQHRPADGAVCGRVPDP